MSKQCLHSYSCKKSSYYYLTKSDLPPYLPLDLSYLSYSFQLLNITSTHLLKPNPTNQFPTSPTYLGLNDVANLREIWSLSRNAWLRTEKNFYDTIFWLQLLIKLSSLSWYCSPGPVKEKWEKGSHLKYQLTWKEWTQTLPNLVCLWDLWSWKQSMFHPKN